jgi:hypothetical protein
MNKRLASAFLSFSVGACSGVDPSSSTPSASDDATKSALCSSIAADLATEMGTAEVCTAMVRLDFSTLEVLGHAFVCGPYAPPSESQARSTARASYSTSDRDLPNALMSGAAPLDAWVFQGTSGDNGTDSAVSALSGRLLFSGQLGYDGSFSDAEPELGAFRGYLHVPGAWTNGPLGAGCTGTSGPPIRGIDLRVGSSVAAKIDDAAHAVLSTALPAAFARTGKLASSLVVAYPGHPAPPDAAGPPRRGAEYIVLLNGGPRS